MSDPFWFLENLEENESESGQKDFSMNYATSQNSGQKNPSEEKSEQRLSQSQESFGKQNVGENKTINLFELLKDDESLRAALENSVLESIKSGQIPEIKITANFNQENSLGDTKSEGNPNTVGTTSLNDNTNIYETLRQKENGQVSGEENNLLSNTENQNIEATENAGTKHQPKVYVILPPEQNMQSNVVDSAPAGDTNVQHCKEVGSAVINLNDLLSSKENATSNNGEITANVDLSSVFNFKEVPKVELVIKVKDERDNPEPTPNTEGTTLKSYSESEIARLKELLKNSATLESLENQLVRSGKEVRNIPIQVTPSSPQTSSTTSYKSVSDTVSSSSQRPSASDWEDKTTDSYVRRDGAQCTRTVWSSPQGRRVETRCFKDERIPPRARRSRDLDWSPRVGSFWNDFDDDIDRLFSYANRFFF